MSNSKVVKVNIFGQEYAFKTSADPAHIKEVAEYLNQKMHDIQDDFRVDSSSQLRIAIFAAINITSDLFDYKHKKYDIINQVEAKANAISEYIGDKIAEIESGNPN